MRAVFLTICLFCIAVSTVSAETVYLKDGTLVRGKITQENESTVIIENKDTWRRIEKSSIELIKADEPQAEQVKQAGSEGEQAGEKQGQSANAAADKGNGETIRNPLYFGLQVPFNMIGGDFDGQRMPDVNPGIGIGLIFGVKLSPNFALELDWAASGHDSEGADIGFGEFSLNGKLWLPGTNEMKPFLFAGFGRFTLGDSSLTFGGSGYNLGIGADFPLTSETSIGVALIRKVITYDEIVKSDTPLRLVGDLNGDTTSIRFDVTRHF